MHALKKQDVNGEIRAVIYGVPVRKLAESKTSDEIEEAFSRNRI